MRVLVVSDTHGKDDNLLKVLEIEKNLDFMVHLGDIGRLEDYIEEITGLACFAVRGNNDWSSLLPADNIIMLGKHKTFITHGHHHNVYISTDDLRRYATALGCDIVMYGHTHIPEIEKVAGVTVVNPGSLTLPRQGNRKPSYILVNIDKNGDADFEIKYLK